MHNWKAANMVGYFDYHWQRLLHGVVISVFPFCAEEQRLLRNAYFWRNIIFEIQQSKRYSFNSLALTVGMDRGLLNKIVTKELQQLEMSDDCAYKLLSLHRQLRPDL